MKTVGQRTIWDFDHVITSTSSTTPPRESLLAGELANGRTFYGKKNQANNYDVKYAVFVQRKPESDVKYFLLSNPVAYMIMSLVVQVRMCRVCLSGELNTMRECVLYIVYIWKK